MNPLAVPRVCMIEQRFARPQIGNVSETLHAELDKLGLQDKILPGQSVAVAVGSRGIRNIDSIVETIISTLKRLGAVPHIIPAMGSHGGGTAAGQTAVLAGYGITEATMGCEIRASMDVVEIGRTNLGVPVFLAEQAASASHIVVVNRVKPHTKLGGRLESGLVKMCLVGLGKRQGAQTFHRAIDSHGWMAVAEPAFEVWRRKAPLLCGVAIVQNAYEDIAQLQAVLAEDFLQVEPQLLEEARRLMGRLPTAQVDLLVVDEIGKEISGTGMDSNVVGRKERALAEVTYVFVRNLTRKTNGNAQGIGLADFTTQRLVNAIDYNALYLNSQTAHRTDSCKIPMNFATDYEALLVATEMAGLQDPAQLRLVWVKNTLELAKVVVSEPIVREARQDRGEGGFTVLQGPMEIAFDSQRDLVSPFAGEPG